MMNSEDGETEGRVFCGGVGMKGVERGTGVHLQIEAVFVGDEVYG